MGILPEKVIKRLSLYHCILTQYMELGLEYISSPKIASLLGIDNSQVRKDIKLVNNIGKCKVGYNVKTLKECIEHSLGFSRPKDAFIVGAGNLGVALTKYDDFINYGLNIVAMFDNDPIKVGMTINKKQILHISKFADLTKRKGIKIAILTVPRASAQKCADMLIEAGIKYIWNFAPCVLNVPEGVHVWNENIIGNFLQFIVNDGVRDER